MKHLLSALFLTHVMGNLIAMEPNTSATEQLIEKKAMELSTAHKEKLAELEQRLAAYDVKIKELEQEMRNQSPIPAAPPLIASTKLPTPPFPESGSKSFLENNKKALIIGGVGLGIVIVGTLAWKMRCNNVITHEDYSAENAR